MQGFAPAPHELLKKFNQNFYLPAALQKRMFLRIGFQGSDSLGGSLRATPSRKGDYKWIF